MAEQATRTDFSDLVRNRRIELGLSVRALHRRCVRPGDTEPAFGHEWLRLLEGSDSTGAPPRLSYLEGLAAGLELPLDVLRAAAAAQYMDVDVRREPIWSRDRSIAITVARMEQLSEADRAELADLAEVYARRKLPQAHQTELDSQ